MKKFLARLILMVFPNRAAVVIVVFTWLVVVVIPLWVLFIVAGIRLAEWIGLL